ncbi:MAG: hypothetical protein LBJ73_02960 [Rickettsiales bacterium]|jgi:hypothetical protein|nr:hypothetical protein [Rickettsiales bacterium]
MKTLSAFCALLSVICIGGANAADAPLVDPNPIPRVSVFSTSTDWEAISGLRLGQYRVKFSGKSKLVRNGLELYFLDGFPCYGQTDRTNIWVSPAGKTERDAMIVCLYVPKTVTFAWRDATRDALQGATTGMLECPIAGDYDLMIDVSKCTRGKDWKEYR